ncbi:hypothetical protein [Streptomyces sp. NPDC000878]
MTLYRPNAEGPNHFTETVLATAHLKGSDDNYKEVTVDLTDQTSPAFLSIRVRIDTEVPPGLYDDFVVTHLFNKSEDSSFVASLGFRA